MQKRYIKGVRLSLNTPLRPWKATLKVLSFTGIKFCDFRNFWPFWRNFVLYPRKVSNHKIAKLNSCRVWDSIFPNIWSKNYVDTRILRISTYSNEIRVSVTYLITITLINNRKIDIQWDFRFLFLLKSRN